MEWIFSRPAPLTFENVDNPILGIHNRVKACIRL